MRHIETLRKRSAHNEALPHAAAGPSSPRMCSPVTGG